MIIICDSFSVLNNIGLFQNVFLFKPLELIPKVLVIEHLIVFLKKMCRWLMFYLVPTITVCEKM